MINCYLNVVSFFRTVFGIYMQILSKNYSKITKSSFIATQNMFFGVFGSIFMLCKLFKQRIHRVFFQLTQRISLSQTSSYYKLVLHKSTERRLDNWCKILCFYSILFGKHIDSNDFKTWWPFKHDFQSDIKFNNEKQHWTIWLCKILWI